MKLKLGTLNTTDIQSVSTRKKIMVRLSDNAQMMIFKSYTKNLYSNIIGSIIRELTSNCYDSHVAAGVNYPIVIRLNKEITGYTISFIDKGTGMSPEVIEEVYGILFESSKRETDEQYGAFGIGSKTPLAYDTGSFFLTTRVDGIEYVYNIYAGATSPEIDPIKESPTTERNGTEIKVTIGNGDLNRFLSEVVKQLFYFENIIFEGFENHLPQINNYTIHYGKSFVYRSNKLNSYMHICMGRVVYPIDYSALGLNAHNWQIPVAIKANISDINITMNRESVEYSDETIAFLRKKMEEVKQELADLYIAQCGEINSIKDYLKYKQSRFELKINENDRINLISVFSSQNSLVLTNFPYNNIKNIINDESLLNIFFQIKMYGNKPTKYDKGLTGSFTEIYVKENIYYSDQKFNRKVLEQAYLKHKYERFYIIKPKFDYSDTDNIIGAFLDKFNSDGNKLTPTIENEIISLFNEISQEINSNVKQYNDIVIPEDFIANKKITKQILQKSNTIINISTCRFLGKTNKEKARISDLAKFKGRIFYGMQEDAQELDFAQDIFEELFDKKFIAKNNNLYNREKTILFLKTTKANEKLIKMLPNAKHINMFKHLILRRKIEKVKDTFCRQAVKEKFDSIDSIYKLHGFDMVDVDIADKVERVKTAISALESSKIDLNNVNVKNLLKSLNIDFTYKFVEEENLNYLYELSKKNKEVLDYLRIYYINDVTINILKLLIKKP